MQRKILEGETWMETYQTFSWTVSGNYCKLIKFSSVQQNAYCCKVDLIHTYKIHEDKNIEFKYVTKLQNFLESKIPLTVLKKYILLCETISARFTCTCGIPFPLNYIQIPLHQCSFFKKYCIVTQSKKEMGQYLRIQPAANLIHTMK